MLSPLPQLIFLLISNLEMRPMILQEGEAIIYATQAMEPLFGYTPTELLSIPALSLAAPHERQRILGYVQARFGTTNNDPTLRYQATGLHKDGHFLHNLVITVCDYPQDRPNAARRMIYFEEESQENLYQFAVEAANIIHGWNRTTLRAIAADLTQNACQAAELRVQELEARMKRLEVEHVAREQARKRWQKHRGKLVAAAATGGALLIQEAISGTGKRILSSLWQALTGKTP